MRTRPTTLLIIVPVWQQLAVLHITHVEVIR
jgi:hypothetical protein